MENLKYTEILQQNKALAGSINGKPYRISILSNVTINSLKEILEYNCRIHQIEPEIEIGNFDNIVQDSAAIVNRDLVIICYDMLSIIDDLDIYFEEITDEAFNSLENRLKSEIDLILNNLSKIPSVVFNTFSAGYFVNDPIKISTTEKLAISLNQYLEKTRRNNTRLINIDKLFIQTGINQALDYRFYHSSKAPYTVTFLKQYVLALQPIVLGNNGKLKKALIFDCDNTLWKGIVGEDGATGIDMDAASATGKFYYRVQQIAAYLSKQGVLVGLCSKNNSDDVAEVLQGGNMVLDDEHLVIKKVNWQDKATNLRNIAHELNIGLDSIVFVDDASFEINFIGEQLPDVLTFQVPANIATYPDQLLQLIYRNFSLNTATEDRTKTQMYKQQFEREDAKATFNSIEDYLASLGLEVVITVDSQQDIPRIAQLTQKTNQFNLTTKRYTESQIEELMQRDDANIFSISVKDKFGDSGLTGVAIIMAIDSNKKTVIIDSFLMSCRIIGRNIEQVFLNHLISYLGSKGFLEVRADYIATKRNAQVAEFYSHSGFHSLAGNQEGHKSYSATISDYVPQSHDYIKITAL